MLTQDDEDDDALDIDDRDGNCCPHCGSFSPWRCYDADTDRCVDQEEIDGVEAEEVPLFAIVLPRTSTASSLLMNDWKVMVWRKRKSAQAYLRRSAPNWHRLRAKVVPYTGIQHPKYCTIR